MRYEVVNVAPGHRRYEELIGQIRANPALLARMWADAEHRLDEPPGKTWTVATVLYDGRWIPAAWAACIEQDGLLRCCDNYEHPGWRGHGLYAAAYRHRHATIVAPSRLPAITYLFAQPIPLHEADGWYRTGVRGISTAAGVEHEWWEMRREPTGAQSSM
ncbi:hypothetical protein GCM10011608_10080 [Micromonospora sonchi]|uniref:Uncharacterized protein n=1 Tax=Micromonospora sonchi TaxID=1763543 RepID=A0A917TM82_9ACTN|nr:hypothetical protein [Micromonospora sonchi]GGM27305.1 hypothetical protein GCM10011608_10080 [Micromonospora sonchi]